MGADRIGMAVCRAVAGALLAVAMLSACTSSAPHPDTSPLSTSASAPPLYCSFVSKASTQTALGTDQLLGLGAPNYATGRQRNLDGGRLVSASCTVSKSNGIALTVDVLPIDARPDVVQQLVNGVAAGQGSYHFPPSYGLGYAFRQHPDATASNLQGATSAILRGNWYVAVSIDSPGPGRNAVDDSVAITRQVIAFLHLPATHAKPYPTPSGS